MNARTLAPLVLGIFIFIALPAAMAAPHAPISINNNNEFTAANGVSNPGAAGSAADPYIIQNWEINGGGMGACISIQGTTRFYVLRRNTCVNANTGFALTDAGNGTIANNTISQLRAGATGFAAGMVLILANNMNVTDNAVRDIRGQGIGLNSVGIFLAGSSNGNILRNNISRIFSAAGAAGTRGTAGTPNGGSGDFGGTVAGVFLAGGFIGGTNNAVRNNQISQLFGGAGGGGGAGYLAGGNGGDGGSAGSALGILAGPFGLDQVNIQSNNISNVYAGVGGSGGAAGFGGGSGGAGGFGGRAVAMLLEGSGVDYTANNNTITSVFAGNGGAGGFGSSGGNGGAGGAGGDSEGINLSGIVNGVVNNNRVTTLFGGNGGNGGFAGFGGALGGNGGNGGNGIGVHFVSTTNSTQSGNNIANFQAGAGGSGGQPGGANGSPGIADDVLIQP